MQTERQIYEVHKAEGGGEQYCDLNKCVEFTLGEYCEYCAYCEYCDLNKCVGFTLGEGERGQLTN